MFTLRPFTPLAVDVRANIKFEPGEVRLRFEVGGDLALVRDPLVEGSWSHPKRADELWRTTCFEAFWGRPGEPGYWELNVAPSGGRWNLYRFDEYRTPQPPRASGDFDMTTLRTTDTTLDVRLRAYVEGPFEASLCAVVRTEAGPTYFAALHAGDKADFHDRRGFVVGR